MIELVNLVHESDPELHEANQNLHHLLKVLQSQNPAWHHFIRDGVINSVKS